MRVSATILLSMGTLQSVPDTVNLSGDSISRIIQLLRLAQRQAWLDQARPAHSVDLAEAFRDCITDQPSLTCQKMEPRSTTPLKQRRCATCRHWGKPKQGVFNSTLVAGQFLRDDVGSILSLQRSATTNAAPGGDLEVWVEQRRASPSLPALWIGGRRLAIPLFAQGLLR